MHASVIISYYKGADNLSLILQALDRQSARGKFEVIVSEDNMDAYSKEWLEMEKTKRTFPLNHIFQPDEGFRKCKALNHSIRTARTALLIFIDGDCIPHKHFVQEYLQAQQPKRVMYGRRLMLSEKISQTILTKKSLAPITLFNMIRTGCKRIEEGLYLPFIPQKYKHKDSGRLLGCNMGINKADLIAINGFDEDYIAPGGGEDSDIEWRLASLEGIHFYSMKFRAIQYHIFHEVRFTAEMEKKNNLILNEKIKLGKIFCKNGLVKV